MAARTNSIMKASMSELSALEIIFTKGIITNAYLSNGIINIIITSDNDDDDTIYIKLSNKELIKYHDCYLLSAINDAIESVDKTDFVTRAELLKKANEAIKNEFCDKTATIAIEELEAGSPIHELDGSVYAAEATTDWTKYTLYEWK